MLTNHFYSYIGIVSLVFFLTVSNPVFGSSQLSIEETDPILCNKSVIGNFILNNSINCDFMNGIIINSSNTRVDFNSSSLLGSGYLNPYTGILMLGSSNITLRGDGSVGHFDTGVLINNTKNVNISNMDFTGNKVSIMVINSSEISITNNYLYTNTVGIKFHNVNSSFISTNSFDSNDISGISFFGSYNDIVDNNLISSSLNGIFLDANSNNITINANMFTRNFGVEINLGDGKTTNETLNLIFNNTCTISIPESIC